MTRRQIAELFRGSSGTIRQWEDIGSVVPTCWPLGLAPRVSFITTPHAGFELLSIMYRLLTPFAHDRQIEVQRRFPHFLYLFKLIEMNWDWECNNESIDWVPVRIKSMKTDKVKIYIHWSLVMVATVRPATTNNATSWPIPCSERTRSNQLVIFHSVAIICDNMDGHWFVRGAFVGR